jgi:hypothetical protein
MSADPRDVALYRAGWAAGYEHGQRDENDDWQAWLGVLRPALNQPRYAEVSSARQPTNAPCRYDDRCKGCSRCTRASAAFRNSLRYGRADYPGAHVRPTLPDDICPKCATTRTTPIRRAGRVHPTLCLACTKAEVGQ